MRERDQVIFIEARQIQTAQPLTHSVRDPLAQKKTKIEFFFFVFKEKINNAVMFQRNRTLFIETIFR